MDCEKFEPLLLDELYEELDELTSAALKRHVAGCSRCAGILNGLRATREGVSVALTEPVPDGLEEKILAAVKEAQKVVPIRSPMSRFLSAAGNWAMRPQTAMAAVFLLMIGTSAFVLKARHAPAESAVSVTVAGEPSPTVMATATGDFLHDDKASAAAHGPGAPPAAQRPAAPPVVAAADDGPMDRATGGLAREKAKGDALGNAYAKDEAASESFAAAAPAPAAEAKKSAAAGGPSSDAFSLGTSAFQSRNYAEATRQFDQAAAAGDTNAALWAAESTKEGQGCAVALGRFSDLAQRASGTWVGNEASYRAARCQMAMGQGDAARGRLNALASTGSHGAQATAALGELDGVATRKAGTPGAGGLAKPSAPARAPAPKPAKPAATGQGQGY